MPQTTSKVDPRVPEGRLRSQVAWLREQWLWLMRTKVIGMDRRRMNALDVGCGPGLVMDILDPIFDVQGVDFDEEAVSACGKRGHRAALADARQLPFADGSFDVVLCSFLLMWVDQPQAALDEMTRVSRRWVVCLAEPDYGGRVVDPPEVAALDEDVLAGLRRRGADPTLGRRLPGMMRHAGLEAEVGVHPGAWNAEEMRMRSAEEWDLIVSDTGLPQTDARLCRAREAYQRASGDGSLCLFNPIFYAIGRK